MTDWVTFSIGEPDPVAFDRLRADAEAFAARCLVQSPTMRAMVADLDRLLLADRSMAEEKAAREGWLAVVEPVDARSRSCGPIVRWTSPYERAFLGEAETSGLRRVATGGQDLSLAS